MRDLILLTLGNGESMRCTNLAHAKERATNCSHIEGKILVEAVPESGGRMMTLEFDGNSQDWIAV